MIHEHGPLVQPELRVGGAAIAELVAASSGPPSNVEHTGQPAGAWLTEAEPEEAVLSLAVKRARRVC